MVTLLELLIAIELDIYWIFLPDWMVMKKMRVVDRVKIQVFPDEIIVSDQTFTLLKAWKWRVKTCRNERRRLDSNAAYRRIKLSKWNCSLRHQRSVRLSCTALRSTLIERAAKPLGIVNRYSVGGGEGNTSDCTMHSVHAPIDYMGCYRLYRLSFTPIPLLAGSQQNSLSVRKTVKNTD